MRVATLCVLILLASTLAAQAADRRTDKSRLVVATLNAEFLWDGALPEDGDADFPWKGSKAKAEAHMAALAVWVRGLDADLLNLAEVEDLRALETFNAKFLQGMGYKAYLVDGNDTATGQDMGLLARIDPASFGRDPRPGQSGGARKAVSKHYIATFDLGGGVKLGMIGIHLIAKPKDQNRRADREAQADAVRRMARELAGQGRQVIVLGDFNDLDGENLDARGERPISRVLEIIRGMDPARRDDDLHSATARLAQDRRFTARAGRGAFSAIDHLLFSPGLAGKLRQVEIREQNAGPRAPSDHFPIKATFAF